MFHRRRFIVFCTAIVIVAGLASAALGVDRFERLRSRVKSGVDFYRDGPFTISRLSKEAMSERLTVIRGFLTNDTNKRVVSAQLEIVCYNEAGDLLGTQLVEVSYLGPRETRQFQAKIKSDAGEITLFEASVQDVVWDEY